MIKEKNYLGIDIGSVSISIAEIDPDKKIINTDYLFHNGEVKNVLLEMLKKYDLTNINNIGITSDSPDIFNSGLKYDDKVCKIDAANLFHKNIKSILIIGGENFGLIQFDDNGYYKSYKSNTSCAAGTGSFLDQQAKRLNFESITDFSEIAFKNEKEFPKIASRCSVFAKTDLIHAQQEGYSLSEISDGLCAGMAKNICDTLFNESSSTDSILLLGGVSKNKAVKKHLERLLDTKIISDEYTHLYGAIGAALNISASNTNSEDINIDNIIKIEENKKEYHYDHLELKLSEYPDFTSLKRYEFISKIFKMSTPVEIDIYENIFEKTNLSVHLGIDIGSTSTKAIIIDKEEKVLAGFYTRTAGRPIEAVQTIFESIDDIQINNNVNFSFLSVGTTGSGRKFIGNIIDGDLALDEITAHARAAYQLDKDVDTIIEIGGQDAKFTTLKNGSVTFSIMNNVCAAGTGSFIEEQAKKLNCPLTEYSDKAENVMAPLASDRCTVFMERDLNHYLNEGYNQKEVLASVLHSVRENYLNKVAIEKNIGNKIFFQGATAKNRALVAAFEQKLQKPIIVSKFCHLTGALGVALTLCDMGVNKSKFKSINIYKNEIPISQEVCNVCTNHCKLKIADINGEKVAYGFLCGRDYNNKKFINQNKSEFDLIKSRQKISSFSKNKKYISEKSIGLPAALHLFDELQMWEFFFNELKIKTVSSQNYKEAIKEGKLISGAEFCAPMVALHGHVKYLSENSDYVFLPVYLENENPKKNTRRHYCYYTQFSSSIIASIDKINSDNKILTPLLKSLRGSFNTRVQLYKTLKKIFKNKISFFQVSKAYDNAIKFHKNKNDKIKKVYLDEIKKSSDVNVVLLGRPYTILSNVMNKNIPDIFGKLGIKTFYQDMVNYDEADSNEISNMLDSLHWHYASEILSAANKIAKSEGIYPVLITSFKCTPDAFVIDYFKKIFDSYNKPYLILQLDEHGSNVGYETRIEAGVRSFKNHFAEKSIKQFVDLNINYNVSRDDLDLLREKTIILPNWDNIGSRLMCAQLKSDGINAIPLEETHGMIQRSLKLNTGQCIPMTAIAQETIEYIEKYNMDTSKTALWMFDSSISCNVKMYPSFLKKTFEEYGKGFENLDVYVGEITHKDISFKTAINAYLANMFSGLIRKIGCKLRPYELIKGETNAVIEKSILILEETLEKKLNKETAIIEIIELFKKIKIKKTFKPKVAIFGDLYVRDNDVMNQDLIKVIEDNGGEVITTPYSEYLKIISDQYIKKWFSEGSYLDAASAKVLKKLALFFENKYHKYFKEITGEEMTNYKVNYEELLSRFNVKIEHTGESMDNILKIDSLMKHYPDISFFVQTNPAYCCPSYITESMKEKLEAYTGVPIVIIEYDGTGGNKNENIIPYLKYSIEKNEQENVKADINC